VAQEGRPLKLYLTPVEKGDAERSLEAAKQIMFLVLPRRGTKSPQVHLWLQLAAIMRVAMRIAFI